MVDQYDAAITNVGKFLIPVALLLWGMTAARARSLRRGANSPALRSLVVALGAWVVVLLQAAFSPMLPWPAGLVAVVLVVALGLWAAGLGVVGLIGARSAGSGVLPAVFGMAIGLGLGGLMSWSAASGYLRSREQAQQRPAPVELADLGLTVWLPVDWRPVDPEKMNAEARLAYVRIEPIMAFLVIGATAEPGHSFEIPDVVEYVRSSLGATSSSVVRQHPLSVGGREGVMLAFDEAGPGGGFNYAVWLSATGSQGLIAMVSADTADATPSEVEAEARRVFETMTFH